MNLTSIVACDKNNVIGANGTMIWHYPEDFKRFKERTLNSTLIMGAKTWESIPKVSVKTGKELNVLPNRHIIVISSRKQPDLIDLKKYPDLNLRFEVVKDFDKALERAQKQNTDIFIGGGAQVYHDTMDIIDFLDFTLVPEVVFEPITTPLDIKYFPQIPKSFKLISEEVNPADSRLTHRLYSK